MDYAITPERDSIIFDFSVTNHDVNELIVNRLFDSIKQKLLNKYQGRIDEYDDVKKRILVIDIITRAREKGIITDEEFDRQMKEIENGNYSLTGSGLGNLNVSVLYDEEGDDTDNGEYHPAQE